MSAYRSIISISQSPAAASRRALLAGAVGGIAALAATAIGGVAPRRAGAAVGDNLKAGSVVTAGGTTSGVSNNSDTNGTWVVTQNGKGTAVRGIADAGTAGRFSTAARHKYALIASNTAAQDGVGAAIRAEGGPNTAISAFSVGEYAVRAASTGGVGLFAQSGGASAGVWGLSFSGSGVFGQSGSGYAVYASGRAYVHKHLDMAEMAAPGAPFANQARLFVRDNGAGKTQLAVVFSSGAVQVIATQP